MQESSDLILKNRYGVFGMWLNWVMSAGSMIFLLFLTRMVSKEIYPFICLGFSVGLYLAVRANRLSRQPICFIMPFIMARVYFFSAMIMMAINAMHSSHVIDLIFTDLDLINPKIPYIAILIMAPLTVVFTAWPLILGAKLPFCQDCIRLNGTNAERGFLGEFFSNEGRFQIRLMLGLSIAMTILAWIYYFFFYVNININSPDRFTFIVAPSIVLLASIIYVGIVYVGVWHYFKHNFDNSMSMGQTTKIRFIIVHGERMLLKMPNLSGDHIVDELRIDTPVTLTVRRKKDVNVDDGREHFTNITNIEDFDIRLLYSNTIENSDFSIYHFLVNLPSEKVPENSRITGEWFSLDEVITLLNDQALTPLLSTEIMRLHKMIMTWKVYKEDGTRRYPIKNYRPMFRISDLYTSDMDFNDLKWLQISANNQDKPFFRLRRLWSRYISGTYHPNTPMSSK